MGKLKKSFLYISLFLVYTQGAWERLFNFSEIVGYVVEIPILLFIFFPPKLRLKYSPGYFVLFAYIIFSYISALMTQSELLVWMKYTRFFIYFFLIFNQFWNSPLKYNEWVNLFKFIFLLIIAQGIGSAYTYLILGKRVEGFVGLMSSLGGTTATIFPLLIVSLSLLIYLYYRNKSKVIYLLIFLCISSVFLVGYVSAKRAIYFTIPTFALVVFFISFYFIGNHKRFLGKVFYSALMIYMLIPIYIFGMSNEHGFNYVVTGNESNIQIILKSIEFANRYESNRSNQRTEGRSGTSKLILKKSFSNMRSFLYGFGVNSYKSDHLQQRLGFSYGVVGFTREILSTGWINMILMIIICLQIILTNKSYKTKFTSSVRIVLFLIFIFTHFFYSADFANHLKIDFLYAIICALINSPNQKDALKTFILKNFIN